MKILLRKYKYLFVVLGIVGSAALISAQTTKTGKVEFKEKDGYKSVIIHPDVKLSPEDEKAMNNVLKKYSTDLYHIETVHNGQKKTMGHATEAAPLKAESAKVKPTEGGTRHNTACPNSPGCNPQTVNSQIVDDLKPILQKYH